MAVVAATAEAWSTAILLLLRLEGLWMAVPRYPRLHLSSVRFLLSPKSDKVCWQCCLCRSQQRQNQSPSTGDLRKLPLLSETRTCNRSSHYPTISRLLFAPILHFRSSHPFASGCSEAARAKSALLPGFRSCLHPGLRVPCFSLSEAIAMLMTWCSKPGLGHYSTLATRYTLGKRANVTDPC